MFALRALTIISLLLGPSAIANATVLYDNTLVTNGGIDPVSGDGPQFNSFTDPGGLVDTVQILLSNGGNIPGNGSVLVGIYNNNGNTPGGLIAIAGTINDTELTSVPTLFTFGGSGADALGFQLSDPTDRFWIGLSDPLVSNSDAAWAFAVDASGTGVAGEFNAFGGDTFPNSAAVPPFQMCVSNNSGTGACALAQAPEPSSLAILGFGLAGFGLLRRRR